MKKTVQNISEKKNAGQCIELEHIMLSAQEDKH